MDTHGGELAPKKRWTRMPRGKSVRCPPQPRRLNRPLSFTRRNALAAKIAAPSGEHGPGACRTQYRFFVSIRKHKPGPRKNMTRTQTRTHFHRSQLIRTLAELEILDRPATTDDFAQVLGTWIDFPGAIALNAIHKAGFDGNREAAIRGDETSVAREFAAARTKMGSTIQQSFLSDRGRLRQELVWPQSSEPVDDAKDYAPIRRCHQAHQREMETHVRIVRKKVRTCIEEISPPLKQLAALDAALEDILSEQEGRLLATLPALMEKRFHHLRRQNTRALHDDTAADDDAPAADAKTRAWQIHFRAELQAVLLAELDLRLQTTAGLLDALQNDNIQNP